MFSRSDGELLRTNVASEGDAMLKNADGGRSAKRDVTLHILVYTIIYADFIPQLSILKVVIVKDAFRYVETCRNEEKRVDSFIFEKKRCVPI